ncbi:MAG: BamA/TamA family outer membrane protein [Cyanobacteria bacterium]|nr:BamA/TamA family outer membrane protein [Cyanobacteriota bacterium]
MPLLVLMAWARALPCFAEDTSDPNAQPPGPTPVNEFAPEDVRPSRNRLYDQGMTISKISIDGNTLIESAKIKDAMSTQPGSLYSKKRLQRDLRRIYDLGYFTEKIRAVPVATGEGIHLRIEVEENAPVTGVNVQGNSMVSDSDIKSIFADQTGMPQNIGQLNESIEKIEKLYAEKGLVLARVKSIQDDPDGTINLDINEGLLKKVQFVGNRKTKDFVLERMMATKPGQVYNEKQLSEDLKRLFSTQSFSDVRRVITASTEDPSKYDLTIEVDEKKTASISLGGGVDTATGIFGSFGVNDSNFLGRGQNFGSIFSVGSGFIGSNNGIARARTYQADISWSNPSLFNTDNALSTGIYGRDMASFNVPLSIERRIGTDVTWSRPIHSLPHTSGSLTMGFENVSLREAAQDARLQYFGLNRNSQARKDMLQGGSFISITPTLAYDTRDSRMNPTSGWLNTVSLSGSYGLGNDSYGTANVNLRRYFKVRDGVTLAFNTQAGSALLGSLPDFNAFRMGGAFSVRGFQEGGIGAGSGFLLGTAEVRTAVPFLDKFKKIPVINSLSTAFFIDGGTVLDESETSRLFKRTGNGASIGAGLRVNIPGMGPIRIDYAIPILGSNSVFKQTVNFGVGQKF